MSEAPALDASSAQNPGRDGGAHAADGSAGQAGLRRLAGFVREPWLLLLPAFVYLYVFPYRPLLRSPNELCRLLQSRALVDYQTIQLNQVMRERGTVGDLSCVAVARAPGGALVDLGPCPQASPDARFCERRFSPSKATLLAFAAAPVYFALKLAAGGVPELALMFLSLAGVPNPWAALPAIAELGGPCVSAFCSSFAARRPRVGCRSWPRPCMFLGLTNRRPFRGPRTIPSARSSPRQEMSLRRTSHPHA
ncbi:MAG: hypothetical protein JXP73_00720 [Deltaproteobacteria bacterium]|nr:hypothetical protein [Deltaproteobacteria bacterium]